MKKKNPVAIFWSYIYKMSDLSKKINSMEKRQLDEKSLTAAFKKMNTLVDRMEKLVDRMDVVD
jgi:hypothetical protein|tara:strand:- start:1818 stop:2006 length:189 start_codon:yes stop_codon:yes gene_type:complete